MEIFARLGSLFGSRIGPTRFSRDWTTDGIHLRFSTPVADETVDALLSATEQASAEDTLLATFLAQLVNEDLAAFSNGGITIPWASVYSLIERSEFDGLIRALSLPSAAHLRPILNSQDTLIDSTFEVLVDGWADATREVGVTTLHGAIAVVDGTEYLLPPASWNLVSEIALLSMRPLEQRTQHENELGWGAIRPLADRAGALYRGPYLQTTFVLTPKTLRMPLQRQDTPFGRVLTIEPTFDGAPPGWLKAFDGFNSVQPHYSLTSSDGGFVRVVISDPVRRVLEVIKREMPGRKVSGTKAERFIHNPWAFIGDSAHAVLDEAEFTQDKAIAGALSAVFSISPRTQDGRIEGVALVVTEHFLGGTSCTDTVAFANADELGKFLRVLEEAMREERPRFPWNEYDLTVDGDSTSQFEAGQQIEHLWRNQPATRISFEDIYGLEGYSTRIEGIGVAKPIYVPLLQSSSSADEERPEWIPGELTPMVKVTLAGHEGQVAIPLSKAWVEEFEGQVEEAERNHLATVASSALPTALDTTQARTLVDGFRTMLNAQDKVRPDARGGSREARPKKETLIVKLNFFGVDYLEERKASLELPTGATAELPASLRPSIELKQHQFNGIAWFQHLVSRAPTDCRGALLADDMGLGKTLQLLAVLGWYYEKNPNACPSIILAPKSILENWAAEARKFFSDSYPRILVLYGDELQARKQPLGLIDEQLHSKGIIDLLKPNWVGDSRIVISTYEVLTNFEFSLARQPFAFVICDEAQRIKTPGTQVTIAAKALKADFRIACTGTPVENTLADLWCLFDFVQPGLLGGLEDFGRSYRRPIECNTDEQKAALKRLQEVIAPQTLRRTKADIAGELKKKYFAFGVESENRPAFKEALSHEERLEVPMSPHQNLLYLGGLKKLQDASTESDLRKRARLSFGALHLMKAVCAEPYCLPGMKFLPDKSGHDVHYTNSPKLRWLLRELGHIKGRNEKAIVFTELREVQAALYYFIRESFGLKPHIINGDSQNRHSYIEQFSSTQGFNVIILSTLAAGAGLNVTAANHVIHFTRAWNPAKENQATDRAYRIGQERDVYVYSPILVSDDYATFDVRLDQLLRRKAGLADATIGGSAMESMLNGAGRDVSFIELAGAAAKGVAPEARLLTMDDVDRMDGFRFEVLCMLLWSKRGYTAQITPKRGGDGGIDVLALKGREGELIQCKSSVRREVGWDAIKEVTAGAALYQARYAGTRFRRVAVTNQTFTSGAKAHAEANHVNLIEREELSELLHVHPVNSNELDEGTGQSVLAYQVA